MLQFVDNIFGWSGWAYFAIGALSTIAIVAAGAAYYSLAYILRSLAEHNLFFTIVEEGTAKVFKRNGRFAFAIMSYEDHAFACDLDATKVGADKWEIRTSPEGRRKLRLPFLRNIHWIGFPPFTQIHRYDFEWTSLKEAKGSPDDLERKADWKQQRDTDYIYLKDDIYVTKLEGADCRDNIPLDSYITIGGRIINPYLALFEIEHWLEATTNVITTRMRSFFGTRCYAELRAIKETMLQSGGVPGELHDYFEDAFDLIRQKYGFEVAFIQIYSIDPAGELARKFIEATTMVYVAEQTKLANIAEGEGLAKRDRSHYEAISGIPGAAVMYKWDRIATSKLTAYVENGGAVATIPIGNDNAARPSNDNPPTNT